MILKIRIKSKFGRKTWASRSGYYGHAFAIYKATPLLFSFDLAVWRTQRAISVWCHCHVPRSQVTTTLKNIYPFACFFFPATINYINWTPTLNSIPSLDFFSFLLVTQQVHMVLFLWIFQTRFCMASVVGPSSTIVTSYAFRNEPQLCSKFFNGVSVTGGNTHSPLWLSCIGPGNKARKHFQLKSSNGHPLNAVSSHDGVFYILFL